MTAAIDRVTRRTQTHYERYPFVQGGDHRVRHWQNRLRPFLGDDLVRGAVVLDVGCGSGEITRGLAEWGARMVALDLTYTASVRTSALCPGAAVCQANAVALPLADDAVDHSVSIGVLHHTPDCFAGIRELARVTRPGGAIVVMLYARWTPYHALYAATAPLRDKVPVTVLERLPHWLWSIVRLAVAVQVGHKLDDDQLKSLVADQIWTPQASFFSNRTISRWARELGLAVGRRQRLFMHANLIELSRVEDES